MAKFQIGWFNVKEKGEYIESPTFAFYKTTEVQAGKYPVYAGEFFYNEHDKVVTNKIKDNRVWVVLNGVITKCSDEDYIGTSNSVVFQPYAHAIAKSIVVDNDDLYELFPEYVPEIVPFVSCIDGENRVTYQIFKRD